VQKNITNFRVVLLLPEAPWFAKNCLGVDHAVRFSVTRAVFFRLGGGLTRSEINLWVGEIGKILASIYTNFYRSRDYIFPIWPSMYSGMKAKIGKGSGTKIKQFETSPTSRNGYDWLK